MPPHEQQRRVAHKGGRVFRRVLTVSSPQAGKLILPDNNRTLHAEILVTAWEHPELGGCLPFEARQDTVFLVPFRRSCHGHCPGHTQADILGLKGEEAAERWLGRQRA